MSKNYTQRLGDEVAKLSEKMGSVMDEIALSTEKTLKQAIPDAAKMSERLTQAEVMLLRLQAWSQRDDIVTAFTEARAMGADLGLDVWRELDVFMTKKETHDNGPTETAAAS